MNPLPIAPESFAVALTAKIVTIMSTTFSDADIRLLEDTIASYARRFSIVAAERATGEADPGNP